MKGLAIHAALALAGLVFAYQTWTRPAVTEEQAQATSDQPVLLACKPEQLERMELELSTHSVSIVPAKERARGEPPVYWLTSSPPASKLKELAEKAAAGDAGVEKQSATNVRAVELTSPVTFRGSARVYALLAELLPLRALRDLGTLDASRDPEFGFDKADKTLRVSCGGQSVELTLAGRTYGNNDSYARDKKTGKTYLLPGKPFMDLQSAQSRLMQNELHTFVLADVDEATVKAGELTKKLVQRDRALPGQAQWVDAAKPDQRNEAFGNWFARVAKLRVRKYLTREQAPGDDIEVPHPAAEPVMTIEYQLEGKPKGKVEIMRVVGENGERAFYGRSETTEVWARLIDTLAKEVESDLPLIVGGAVNSSEPTPASDFKRVEPHN